MAGGGEGGAADTVMVHGKDVYGNNVNTINEDDIQVGKLSSRN
jgi:hypothetical protein